MPHLQINLSRYLKIRHQCTHNLWCTEINGNDKKREGSVEDNMSSKHCEGSSSEAWTTAHYVWEETRNHIMSMAISSPAGHRCTVHNNMEWWGDREEKREREGGRESVGGSSGRGGYSLTLWHFCHQLQCLSLSLTHTHWGLRPCTGTWKFSLQFSAYPKVTCYYERSHNISSEHNLLSYLSWTNILIS